MRFRPVDDEPPIRLSVGGTPDFTPVNDTAALTPSVAGVLLPRCERCGIAQATTSLNFSFRGEEYAARYYCAPCCDVAWIEGVAEVDRRAEKLKTRGL